MVKGPSPSSMYGKASVACEYPILFIIEANHVGCSIQRKEAVAVAAVSKFEDIGLVIVITASILVFVNQIGVNRSVLSVVSHRPCLHVGWRWSFCLTLTNIERAGPYRTLRHDN